MYAQFKHMRLNFKFIMKVIKLKNEDRSKIKSNDMKLKFFRIRLNIQSINSTNLINYIKNFNISNMYLIPQFYFL